MDSDQPNQSKPASSQQPIQWSMQDILLGMVYAGLVSAVLAYLGSAFAATFFFVFSLLLIAACGLDLVYKRGAIGIGFVAALFLGSLGLLLNCLLHAALVMAFHFFESRKDCDKPISRRIKLHASVLLTLISLFACLYPGYIEYQKLVAIRNSLPLENLAPRLSTLNKTGGLKPKGLVHQTFPPNNIVTDRWLDFEVTLESDFSMLSYDRHRHLHRVHDRHVESFIKSEGLGVGRMVIGLPRVEFDLPPLANVPFLTSGKEESDPLWELKSRWHGDGLLDFHFDGLRGFFEPVTFGVPYQEETVGFVPHAFYFPAAPIKHGELLGITVWNGWHPKLTTLKLERLELVSLLRFDEPKVYQLDHLPRMDQLNSDSAPTRALNEFETESLARVHAGEDVVAQAKGDQVLMFGAIRAVNSCIDCHSSGPESATRGALLGAFSYRFQGTEEFSTQPK